jgi:hypothetical protein
VPVLSGATTQADLLELTAAGIPIHVIAGLGGWLTFTAMGVSYRLLAMFMLHQNSIAEVPEPPFISERRHL